MLVKTETNQKIAAAKAGMDEQTARKDRRLGQVPSLRVRSAVLLLIIGMLVPPLLLAFARHLVIFRASRQLLAEIIGTAPALALRLTADSLLGTINGREKWRKEH